MMVAGFVCVYNENLTKQKQQQEQLKNKKPKLTVPVSGHH